MQNAYKAAVEEWIAAIKHEEALLKTAKKQYEDALREKFFGF